MEINCIYVLKAINEVVIVLFVGVINIYVSSARKIHDLPPPTPQIATYRKGNVQQATIVLINNTHRT